MENNNAKIIPKEWKKIRLGECIKLQGGFAFKSSEFSDSGLPILRISNIKISGINLDEAVYYPNEATEVLSNFFLEENDVVIAMSGATTGKIGVIKKNNLPLLINQRVGRFVIKDKNKLANSFLQQIVTSKYFQERVNDMAIGGAQPNISGSQIESINTLLPSLSEQTKIAEILSSVDEEIEKVSQEIKKTEELKSGLIQKLFREGKKRQIKDVVFVNSEQTNPLNYPKVQYNYIDIASIEENEIKEVKQFLGENAPSRARRVIKTGDIIISTVRPNLRDFVYIEEKYNNFLCSTGFCVLRSDISKIESKYLYFLISSFKFTDFLVKKTTGSNYPAVNPSDIKEYEFNLPDTQRQKEIANFLSSVDNKIIINKQIKNKLAELKKGLMQDLLSGRVKINI